ncbi:MAG: c-type cytochrome [Pirellulaceae bacterium]
MESPPDPNPPLAPSAARTWRWRAALAGLLVAVLAVALFGRSAAAWYARQTAARRLDAAAIGPAVRSLDWAERVNPGDYCTDLLRADCFRRLGERDAWQRAIESAEEHGAPDEPLRLARRLGDVRWGEDGSVSRGDYDELLTDGATPREAAEAVVQGLLTQRAENSQAIDQAESLSDAWATDPADEAEAAHLRGVCAAAAGNREAARAEFEKTLQAQPGHEPAHNALARLLEEQYLLNEALPHAAAVYRAAGQRESARLGLARVLRKLGRLDDARRVLRPPADPAEASASAALELGETAYEAGDYAAAARWFKQADLEGPHIAESLRAAASNFAYAGDFARSAKLFARIDDAQGYSRQAGELQRRIGIDPSDAIASAELQRLLAEPRPEPTVASVSPLYAEHCAACHGANGNGAGRAARHLYPRPRNLRADKYRLVSTLDLTPSLDDIDAVLRLGIPGTSMPDFAGLPAAERQQLARDVQQLYRTRLSEEAAPAAEQVLPVPAIGPTSAESLARGKVLYFKSGCQHCHGDDGTGASAAAMLDDEGRPTVPRNLVREPMKGGPSGESLYRRIRLGMLGTPHPASPSLAEADLIALVHYCQSLAAALQQPLTNHERAIRAARRLPPSGFPQK